MATIRIVLKKNKKKANGLIPIYLRIIEGEKNTFKSTGIDVPEDCWDEKNQRVKSKYPNSGRINQLLAKKISELEDIKLELDGKRGIGKAIKTISEKKGKSEKSSFTKFFQEHVDQQKIDKNFGNHKKAQSILKKFNEYNKHRDILFSDFTIEYLRDYENYLRGLGNCTNTIHANLKVFRMLFNKAVNLNIILIQNNPFKRYELKKEKTEMVFLTKEEVDKIAKVKVAEGSKMEIHRDMFVFACYAGGIRISDLLQLRVENYNRSTKILALFIHKTKNNHTIKIPKKAVTIIENYIPQGRKKGYIFGLLDEEIFQFPEKIFHKVSSATASANKSLKKILSLADIDKKISFHTSRHTFGTNAATNGIGIQTIAKIMVHTNLSTTLGYAKIVDSVMYDSMDKMDT